jgi:GNAT superfamily N-acetyltransferase
MSDPTTYHNGFTLTETAIPERLGDDELSNTFREMVDVRNEIEADSYGSRDLAYEADELHPNWLDPHQPKRLLLARVDGRIVGRASIEVQINASKDVGWLLIEILPEFRGRGIGTAALERLVGMAMEGGQTVLQGWGAAKEIGGERLASPTGFGSIPLADASVRFALKHGFALEQVERSSKLLLPVDVSAHLADAKAAAGPDYRVHTWAGDVPEQWREDYAVLLTRMSTDAPAAGLDIDEDPWTVERLVEEEERERDSPRTYLTAAAEHVPTSTLVAFSVLSAPTERERAVSQDDTLVLKEHRGHRLGMLLKAANLDFLQTERSGHPAVTTFNAAENVHMLAVNDALGFKPVVWLGAWKRATQP